MTCTKQSNQEAYACAKSIGRPLVTIRHGHRDYSAPAHAKCEKGAKDVCDNLFHGFLLYRSFQNIKLLSQVFHLSCFLKAVALIPFFQPGIRFH